MISKAQAKYFAHELTRINKDDPLGALSQALMNSQVDLQPHQVDAAAFALIVTARELGIRVPDELSVIGFDDVIYTQMIHPYITTMRQPCAALGARAMDILNEMINGRMPEEKEVILPTALIVRESTSPA